MVLAGRSASSDPGAAVLITAAMATPHPLISHLEMQRAPRAAARVASAFQENIADAGKTTGHPCESVPLFTVDASKIVLVHDEDSCLAFIAAMDGLISNNETTVGLDVEWRPEHYEKQTRPSLLQLATAEGTWLVDLDAVAVMSSAALRRVADILSAPNVRILGFGLQQDIDKLQTLFDAESGYPSDFRLTATHVIDLKSTTTIQGPSASGSEGLARQLARWCGMTLDKTMQCSDWARRPLSDAQVQYAAADAACLLLLNAALAAATPDARVVTEVRATAQGMRTSDESKASERVEASRSGADGEALRAEEDPLVASGLSCVQEVAASVLGGHARVARVDAAGCDTREEVNSLCFTAGQAGLLLVLTPASQRMDLRWLALALELPKRRVKLASPDEVADLFGARAGSVPPVPLRKGIRVLCHPRLRCGSDDGEVSSGSEPQAQVLVAEEGGQLWGSAAHPAFRLLIDAPKATLPALARAAVAFAADEDTGADASSVESAAVPPSEAFTWLPEPSLWHPTLDEALEQIHSLRTPVFREDTEERSAGDEEGNGEVDDALSSSTNGGGRCPDVRLIVDPSLSVLARKLRMVGIDTQVAGEVIKHADLPGMMLHANLSKTETAVSGDDVRGGSSIARARQSTRRKVGLMRVGIDAKEVEGHMRRAALEGRLIVTTAKEKTANMLPGACYRLLAADAGQQFAELLTVLGMCDAVDAGGSRCGICNGNAWITLHPNEVKVGEVPRAVVDKQSIFYKCGACQQIFWPGEKYDNTMVGLRADAANEAVGEPPRAGTSGQLWRPPSGSVTPASLP